MKKKGYPYIVLSRGVTRIFLGGSFYKQSRIFTVNFKEMRAKIWQRQHAGQHGRRARVVGVCEKSLKSTVKSATQKQIC
jgi:hypothetical protein